MSTDLETRLRADLPRLADGLEDPSAALAVGREPKRPSAGGRRVLAVASVAVVALVVLVAVVARRDGDRQAGHVDTGPASVDSSWTPMATSPLSPREGAVAVWTGSEVIVWGGHAGLMAFQDGAAYDPATDTWRSITPNSWAHPGGQGVWTGTEMIVLAKNGGAAYNPSTDSWHDLPQADDANFIAPVWTGTQLIGIGQRVTANGELELTATALASSGDRWEPAVGQVIVAGPSATPDPIRVAWTGGQIAVWGADGEQWLYDPSSSLWRSMRPIDDAGAALVSIPVGVDGTLHLVEEDVGPSRVIRIVRWVGDLREEFGSTTGYAIDPDTPVVASGDAIFVLPLEGPPLVASASTGEWRALDGSPVPDGSDRSVVSTGDAVVMWGGVDPTSGQDTASGWVWRPAS